MFYLSSLFLHSVLTIQALKEAGSQLGIALVVRMWEFEEGEDGGRGVGARTVSHHKELI